MNISFYPTIRNCTSCQMCAAICQFDAIIIEQDKQGFYRPVINGSKCKDCGACVQVCYKYDENILETTDLDLEKYNLYAASAKNKDVLRSTTSGGMADLMAKELIQQGYKVLGVVFDCKTNRAVTTIASTIKETEAFRGSKYIQSYSYDAFSEFVKTCGNEKYAIFGLPCHIYAINKYLEKRQIRENFILIDLFCHGCPSMNVWKKVSSKIRKETNTSVFDNVIFRSKKNGWGSFVLEIQKNGNTIYSSSPMHNDFFDLFFCNQVLNDACFDCKARSTLKYTDIRLGDFWGPKYHSNLTGISGVAVVTKKGEELLDAISKDVLLRKESFEIFLPYQS